MKIRRYSTRHYNNYDDVPCSTCGAAINQFCLMQSGKEYKSLSSTHTQRMIDWNLLYVYGDEGITPTEWVERSERKRIEDP